MAGDLAQWLDGIGLGQYSPAFADNAVDLYTLPQLSDDDLKGLGHRRKLQAALKGRSAEPVPEGAPNRPVGERSTERTATGEAVRRHNRDVRRLLVRRP